MDVQEDEKQSKECPSLSLMPNMEVMAYWELSRNSRTVGAASRVLLP